MSFLELGAAVVQVAGGAGAQRVAQGALGLGGLSPPLLGLGAPVRGEEGEPGVGSAGGERLVFLQVRGDGLALEERPHEHVRLPGLARAGDEGLPPGGRRTLAPQPIMLARQGTPLGEVPSGRAPHQGLERVQALVPVQLPRQGQQLQRALAGGGRAQGVIEEEAEEAGKGPGGLERDGASGAQRVPGLAGRGVVALVGLDLLTQGRGALGGLGAPAGLGQGGHALEGLGGEQAQAQLAQHEAPVPQRLGVVGPDREDPLEQHQGRAEVRPVQRDEGPIAVGLRRGARLLQPGLGLSGVPAQQTRVGEVLERVGLLEPGELAQGQGSGGTGGAGAQDAQGTVDIREGRAEAGLARARGRAGEPDVRRGERGAPGEDERAGPCQGEEHQDSRHPERAPRRLHLGACGRHGAGSLP